MKSFLISVLTGFSPVYGSFAIEFRFTKNDY